MVDSELKGLLRCSECGFITANMDSSTEELESLYSDAYFNGEEYADYLADQKMIEKNFRHRLSTLRKVLGIKPDLLKLKSVFEIGCAYGFFLKTAQDVFRQAAGIDISKEATEYAKDVLGVNAYTGDYESFTPSDKVDVICMWDTIEHLSCPDKYIEKAYAHLQEDGVICITTGDISSLNARIRGEKWRQIHPPTHLHYFSAKTLHTLLERNGFEVLYTGHPSNYISMNTALYTLQVKNRWLAGFYNIARAIGFTKVYVPVNLFDFVYVIARRV